MDRLKVAFDEGKETVGSFVLDAITPLVSGLVNNVIPTISALASEIGENLKPVFENVTTFVTETLIPAFTNIWTFITDYLIPTISSILIPIMQGLYDVFQKVRDSIVSNEDNLRPLLTLFKAFATFAKEVLAPVLGTVLKTALNVVGTVLSGLISGFAQLVGFISSVVNGVRDLINLVKNNPVVKGIGGLIDNVFGGGRASGGSVSAGTTYMVGEKGAELFTPTTNGTIIPNHALGGGGTTINLTVNGAIDAEGTARTIIDVLNRSSARGTLGAGKLTFA
jgi:hypothetical protein